MAVHRRKALHFRTRKNHPPALSNGHLHNLRKSRTYQRRRTVWTRTKPPIEPL